MPLCKNVGHKDVEAMQSYRPELSHLLEGQQEVQRQVKESASQTRDKSRMRNWSFTTKASHRKLENLQKCLYWLMCLVYLLSWMIQFLTY
uniref:Uncharacterized protein n=1 Tax=Spermophilus dauricus TaxID=99837 RepID=A0A8C9PWC0_SPEDA